MGEKLLHRGAFCTFYTVKRVFYVLFDGQIIGIVGNACYIECFMCHIAVKKAGSGGGTVMKKCDSRYKCGDCVLFFLGKSLCIYRYDGVSAVDVETVKDFNSI